MTEIIAIIPARGGSKRIPRKNIKSFCGIPVISYPIANAIQSKIFTEVMVSTDDEEIASISLDAGAKVPFYRSSENSTDLSSTIDVILEVLNNYEKQGRYFEYGCCIYPCTPLLRPERLIEAKNQLISDSETDVVIPLLRYTHPIQRALKLENDFRIKQLNPKMMTVRTQDMQTAYHDSGQFYFFRTKSLRKYHSIWCAKAKGVELEEMEAQDIDTLNDWILAEFKFKLLRDK
jgi:pseudaminic acid cytidylyltransferase